ncbi:MAG: hypothetical protein WBI14_07030 [Anaerolineaceae bacterium]
MIKNFPPNNIEEELKRSFTPTSLPRDFKASLRAKISQEPPTRTSTRRPLRWAFALAPLVLILVVVLAVGPQNVWAQIQRAFGFLPGHGLVDQTAPLRVLAEPVSLTKDGITVDVTSALLTASDTTIEYRVFGLTRANYPQKETDPMCSEVPRLILPDGTIYNRDAYAFPPISEFINQATFVLPCLQGTLRSNTPEDWRFELKFVPSTNLTPLLAVETIQTVETPSTDSPSAAVAESLPNIQLVHAIETAKGYILTGLVNSEPGALHLVMTPTLTDANGEVVPTFFPEEVNQLFASPEFTNKRDTMVMAFNSQDLAFPVTIQQEYYPITIQHYDIKAMFSFDVGSDPLPGQRWELNRKIDLGDFDLILKEIEAAGTGYKFSFDAPSNLSSLDIFIDGFSPIGAGGGSGIQDGFEGRKNYQASINFQKLPTGVLQFTLTGLRYYEPPLILTKTWQPATPHAAYPVTPSDNPTCLVGSSLSEVAGLSVFDERYILIEYGPDPVTKTYRVMLKSDSPETASELIGASMDGAFSPDASQLVYTLVEDGNAITTIADLINDSKSSLSGTGMDFDWSPDSQYIAMITSAGDKINFPTISSVDDMVHIDLTEFNYAYIIGWSPDSQTLYFTAPFIGSPSWKVMAYSLEKQQTTELFVIENATPKALRPDLSPDGQWLTYRGQDNSSLMMVNLNDQTQRVLLEKSNVLNAKWLDNQRLAVSLLGEGNDFRLLVLDITNCDLAQVEGQFGELIDITLLP